MNKMANTPSSYDIANLQRIRGFIPSQVKASAQIRQIGQSVQQTRGIRNLEDYEINCQRMCQSARISEANMNSCVQSCVQQVMEQTRVG